MPDNTDSKRLMVQIIKGGAWHIDRGNGNTWCSKAWNTEMDTAKAGSEFGPGYVKICKTCLRNWHLKGRK